MSGDKVTEQPRTVSVGSTDWFASLREYVDAEELAKTRRMFDGHHVSHDLIVIATALRGLAESCDDAAEFALADERPLKAEEYQQRGAAYRKCYKTLVKVWDGREANT
jgi:hypothetical protein